MSRFTIGIAGRNVDPHTACFEDFATALAESLKDLGHTLSDFDNPGRFILFGANNMTGVERMPEDAIIFNTEQVASTTGVRAQMNSFEAFKNRIVWDYSKANIKALTDAGLSRVVHCPLWFHPNMMKIGRSNEDIDVLFYGSLNDRRQKIVDALKAEGLNVNTLFGVYGKERDSVIARSKVVLNVHFYERPVFEIFRTSHLFANRKAVVTEGGGIDEELESFASRAAWRVSYDEVVQACVDLVRLDDLRQATAERGFVEFSKTNLIESVMEALRQS